MPSNFNITSLFAEIEGVPVTVCELSIPNDQELVIPKGTKPKYTSDVTNSSGKHLKQLRRKGLVPKDFVFMMLSIPRDLYYSGYTYS